MSAALNDGKAGVGGAEPMPRGRKIEGNSPREAGVRRARARREAVVAQAPRGWCDLAAKLERLIEARGMTQSSLSKVIENLKGQGLVDAVIHQTRISKWLKRSGEPNHVQTHALAVALRVPLCYLADPRRVEVPDVRALERELEFEATTKRLGIDIALDRLQLRPTVEVLATTPADLTKTYAAEQEREVAKPKIKKGS